MSTEEVNEVSLLCITSIKLELCGFLAPQGQDGRIDTGSVSVGFSATHDDTTTMLVCAFTQLVDPRFRHSQLVRDRP